MLTLNVLFSHRCNHGIVASSFEFDEDVGIVSMPDYYDKCPECTEAMKDTLEAIRGAAGGISLL